MMPSNYDKFPAIHLPAQRMISGWDNVADELSRNAKLAIDCYPGVNEEEIASALSPNYRRVIFTRDLLKSEAEIDRLVEPFLGGDDPVFGRMTSLRLKEFFDQTKVAEAQAAVSSNESVLVIGVGAKFCSNGALLCYADLPRWEIQMRQRAGKVSNLGSSDRSLKPSLQYKRAFFIDWRVADQHKRDAWNRVQYWLDTTISDHPKLISHAAMDAALDQATRQPFRVVPFFDPGPWGGQWMKEVCDLDRAQKNYAWCFDCVPEENSLFLTFGPSPGERFELPSINLVFRHPEKLLGPAVYGRFGAEFPIRFDFLDTMAGGNLSLQVHPLTEYIQKHFGMHYTQDESYYLLDAKDDATVYLGVKDDCSKEELFSQLRTAQTSGATPDVERFVNKWPAKKHDHFLIPAGTIHCSGKNAMVLEISATPYIFTFKLYDWGRLGLDGKPRPIHLDHGSRNVRLDRNATLVKNELINAIVPIASGEGWREERTGLHEAEFIETRRHWFTGVVPHDTRNTVNVLNLIEGREAIVESPTNAFEPFVVHYAETFIVPASVGKYTIRPHGESVEKECATLKAFVRSNA